MKTVFPYNYVGTAVLPSELCWTTEWFRYRTGRPYPRYLWVQRYRLSSEILLTGKVGVPQSDTWVSGPWFPGYERVYLPLGKVADKPFHIQGEDIFVLFCVVRLNAVHGYFLNILLYSMLLDVIISEQLLDRSECLSDCHHRHCWNVLRGWAQLDRSSRIFPFWCERGR